MLTSPARLLSTPAVVVTAGAFDPPHIMHWLVTLATVDALDPVEAAYLMPMRRIPGKVFRESHKNRVAMLNHNLQSLLAAAQDGGAAALGANAAPLTPYLRQLKRVPIEVLDTPGVGDFTPAGFDGVVAEMIARHPGHPLVFAAGQDGVVGGAQIGSVRRGYGWWGIRFALVPRGEGADNPLRHIDASLHPAVIVIPATPRRMSSTEIRQELRHGRPSVGLVRGTPVSNAYAHAP